MVKGKACGKVILLGEHFVVHGVPAIAVGITNCCEVTVEESDETIFYGPAGTSKELSGNAISNILNSMKINKKYAISYGGNLPIFGGLGSSAAFCVAIVRALAKEYKLTLTDEQINSYAYEGEKSFHGNPSGIDNVMATYGGVMLFTKKDGKHKFKPIQLKQDLHLVIGITGVFGPTSKMVAKVGEYKKQNPEKFESLAKEAKSIVEKGEIALEEGNIVSLGLLMDKNQKLLQEISVSIEINDKLVGAMKKSGALGAKITGGGGGGTCLALAKDEEHAKQILQGIKKSSFEGFTTKVSKRQLF